MSIDWYLWCISLLKNSIDSRLDGLELWLKYLQLSSFEFFEIHNFWKPILTHKLLLQIWTKIVWGKIYFSLTLLQGFGREAVENENRNVHYSSHHVKEERSTTKIKVWHFTIFYLFYAYNCGYIYRFHVEFVGLDNYIK